MRPLMNYFGGKWNSAPWIISNFPEHKIYVEVFGGAASVLLRKPRSNREVLNDIDSEVVNLYFVARDHSDALMQKLALTPLSRVEYEDARIDSIDPVERARRTIVKSYFGIGDSLLNRNGFRFSKESNTCVAKSWLSYVSQFIEIVDRMMGVTIEKLCWEDCIDKYDHKDVLFYLDPPYVGATRSHKKGYAFEFINADHVKLLEKIKHIKGKFVLSGYNNDFYKDAPGKMIEKTFRTQGASKAKESIWISTGGVD